MHERQDSCLIRKELKAALWYKAYTELCAQLFCAQLLLVHWSGRYEMLILLGFKSVKCKHRSQ